MLQDVDEAAKITRWQLADVCFGKRRVSRHSYIPPTWLCIASHILCCRHQHLCEHVLSAQSND